MHSILWIPPPLKLKNSEWLVLGDWHHQGWYIRVTEKPEPELISFAINH